MVDPGHSAEEHKGTDPSETMTLEPGFGGGRIDHATFEQILEMDDDPADREFSQSIVIGFFEQAKDTFKQMEEALKEKDLDQIAGLGHFLKGSSATLGLTQLRDECEKLQHYGSHKDATGLHDQKDDELCLRQSKDSLEKAQAECKLVKADLKRLYPEMPE